MEVCQCGLLIVRYGGYEALNVPDLAAQAHSVDEIASISLPTRFLLASVRTSSVSAVLMFLGKKHTAKIVVSSQILGPPPTRRFFCWSRDGDEDAWHIGERTRLERSRRRSEQADRRTHRR